jgi:hypothetical protein
MWGIGRCSGSGFIVVFFILTITFCLVSAGIFKANTAITMDAYAKKSKDSSGGSKGDDSSSGSNGGGGRGPSMMDLEVFLYNHKHQFYQIKTWI